MADIFTDNFNLALQGIGGNASTWGNKINNNFDILDLVIREVFPVGIICQWSGASIPTGWALCDGSNGTPDLRDRFVIGAGDTYSVGDTGGASTVALSTSELAAHNHAGTTGNAGNHSHSASTGAAGSHSHSASMEITGAHQHSYNRYASVISVGATSAGGSRWADVISDVSTTDGFHSHNIILDQAGDHSHSLSTFNGGSHSHSITTGSTGGGGSHQNLPPYYALSYIMRLS